MKRAKEEVEILEAEFRCSRQWFTYNSEIWTKMAEREKRADYGDHQGWPAYAHKPVGPSPVAVTATAVILTAVFLDFKHLTGRDGRQDGLPVSTAVTAVVQRAVGGGKEYSTGRARHPFDGCRRTVATPGVIYANLACECEVLWDKLPQLVVEDEIVDAKKAKKDEEEREADATEEPDYMDLAGGLSR
ncbi:hypothetical protein K438DRAFT_1768625 [Mycena galopus ATCC 62051]|nr:hypothetical protein K438DRAFT_1768625 [Mycena galopus ATCC 62051]